MEQKSLKIHKFSKRKNTVYTNIQFGTVWYQMATHIQ